ncbi:Uncharacterised protein [Bordetella pertussis]|nr:Uncharacterised protein [Bordetella pertussis]CPO19864.1 Uncharacterised protein [Bordetella pertussis]
MTLPDKVRPMISSARRDASMSRSRSMPVSMPSSWHSCTMSSVQILPAACILV